MSSLSELDENILAQFADIELDAHKPLIVSDADEVLLLFMQRFEHFLDQRNLWIDLKSYSLNDNIRCKETNKPVEVAPDLLAEFFASETRHIAPNHGAQDALARLSERAQILILSNLPLEAKQARKDNLAAHGMDYPLFVGKGLKGPLIARLIENHAPPIFFLDDIPHNIDSVAEHAAHVSRIHFVADPRLARLVPKAKLAHVRIDIWDDAHDWIDDRLTRHGF